VDFLAVDCPLGSSMHQVSLAHSFFSSLTLLRQNTSDTQSFRSRMHQWVSLSQTETPENSCSFYSHGLEPSTRDCELPIQVSHSQQSNLGSLRGRGVFDTIRPLNFAGL
jgi:hypothetical protein